MHAKNTLHKVKMYFGHAYVVYMATYGTMFCKLLCIYVCMPNN